MFRRMKTMSKRFTNSLGAALDPSMVGFGGGNNGGGGGGGGGGRGIVGGTRTTSNSLGDDLDVDAQQMVWLAQKEMKRSQKEAELLRLRIKNLLDRMNTSSTEASQSPSSSSSSTSVVVRPKRRRSSHSSRGGGGAQEGTLDDDASEESETGDDATEEEEVDYATRAQLERNDPMMMRVRLLQGQLAAVEEGRNVALRDAEVLRQTLMEPGSGADANLLRRLAEAQAQLVSALADKEKLRVQLEELNLSVSLSNMGSGSSSASHPLQLLLPHASGSPMKSAAAAAAAAAAAGQQEGMPSSVASQVTSFQHRFTTFTRDLENNVDVTAILPGTTKPVSCEMQLLLPRDTENASHIRLVLREKGRVFSMFIGGAPKQALVYMTDVKEVQVGPAGVEGMKPELSLGLVVSHAKGADSNTYIKMETRDQRNNMVFGFRDIITIVRMEKEKESKEEKAKVKADMPWGGEPNGPQPQHRRSGSAGTGGALAEAMRRRSSISASAASSVAATAAAAAAASDAAQERAREEAMGEKPAAAAAALATVAGAGDDKNAMIRVSAVRDQMTRLADELTEERGNYERLVLQMLDLANDLNAKEDVIADLRLQVRDLKAEAEARDSMYATSSHTKMRLGKQLEAVSFQKHELEEQLAALSARVKEYESKEEAWNKMKASMSEFA